MQSRGLCYCLEAAAAAQNVLQQCGRATDSRTAGDRGWGSRWLLRHGASGKWLGIFLPRAPRVASGSRTL